MSSSLIIETQIIDNKLIATFTGKIDEDATFEKILSVKQEEYIFDFQNVTLLNSCGIREWISFLDELEAGSKITYKNCPQIIIEQMNMVHGFIKEGATIESFFAPYYCEKCDKEIKSLLLTSEINDAQAPTSLCPTCNDKMEFDAIESQYFNFLKTHK